uniref:Uncharacterized protein n=1 Tax=Gadus morhua TaxID=8049 RepID=A0A8C5A6Q1_GADMO
PLRGPVLRAVKGSLLGASVGFGFGGGPRSFECSNLGGDLVDGLEVVLGSFQDSTEAFGPGSDLWGGLGSSVGSPERSGDSHNSGGNCAVEEPLLLHSPPVAPCLLNSRAHAVPSLAVSGSPSHLTPGIRGRLDWCSSTIQRRVPETRGRASGCSLWTEPLGRRRTSPGPGPSPWGRLLSDCCGPGGCCGGT